MNNVTLNGRENLSDNSVSIIPEDSLASEHTVSDSTATPNGKSVERPASPSEPPSFFERVRINAKRDAFKNQREISVPADLFDFSETGRLRADDYPEIAEL